MIPRYSTSEMTKIWSTNNKYRIWLRIEILACEIQEKLGNIPINTTKEIKKRAIKKNTTQSSKIFLNKIFFIEICYFYSYIPSIS